MVVIPAANIRFFRPHPRHAYNSARTAVGSRWFPSVLRVVVGQYLFFMVLFSDQRQTVGIQFYIFFDIEMSVLASEDELLEYFEGVTGTALA